MAFPPQSHNRPQVIQGNFQGGQPTFVAQARPGFPGVAQRQVAPHVAAAVGQHQGSQPPTAQRKTVPQSPTAQPSRIGNAFQVPTTVNLSRPGQGRPLPDTLRQKMESFFNSDFSDVRVHVGEQAPSIGAVAFTMGSQIHFAPGQYNPNTSHGQRLLGHELTHVMQQRAGRVRNPFGTGVAVVQDPGMEAEADRMGIQAAAYRAPVQAKLSPAPGGRSQAPHVEAAVAQAKMAQAQARPLTTAGPPEVTQGKSLNLAVQRASQNDSVIQMLGWVDKIRLGADLLGLGVPWSDTRIIVDAIEKGGNWEEGVRTIMRDVENAAREEFIRKVKSIGGEKPTKRFWHAGMEQWVEESGGETKPLYEQDYDSD